MTKIERLNRVQSHLLQLQNEMHLLRDQRVIVGECKMRTESLCSGSHRCTALTLPKGDTHVRENP